MGIFWNQQELTDYLARLSRLYAQYGQQLWDCGVRCSSRMLARAQEIINQDPFKPHKLHAEHPFNIFIRALGRRQANFQTLVPRKVVSLGNGVHFPFMAMSQLYVRQCYVDLVEADEACRSAHNVLLTYITGTPGMGKTCCAVLHLCRSLASGHTVILENRSGEGRDRFIKMRLGEMVLASRYWETFCRELCSKQGEKPVHYFVVGSLPSAWQFTAPCWAYTSPSSMTPKALKEVMRGHGKTLTLEMPVLELDELQEMRQSVEWYKECLTEVEHFFKLAGGNARMVLDSPSARTSSPVDDVREQLEQEVSTSFQVETVRQQLEEKVKDLCKQDVQAMFTGLWETGHHSACDVLLHWNVFTEEDREEETNETRLEVKKHRRFRYHHIQFASAYVAALVGRYASANIRRHLAEFLLSRGEARVRGWAGIQFEQLVHASLPMLPVGMKLKLKLLESGEEFFICLPPSKPLVFSSLQEAGQASKPDGSVYLMPVNSNEAAIDCLLSPKLLFQVAPGPSHTINLEGINKTCEVLTSDEAKFQAAAEALENMVTGPAQERKRKRRRGPVFKPDVPLLVFVTSDQQYPHWKQPQAYVTDEETVQPWHPPVEQAVLCLPTAWAAEGFPEQST